MATKDDSSTTRGTDRERFSRPQQAISKRNRKRAVRAMEVGVLGALIVFIGFPMYYLFINAFSGPEAIFTPTIIPERISFQNFEVLFEETIILTYLKNSLIVAAGSTTITVLVATIGGYGLARSNFRGQRNMARSVLFTYMFPPILLGIPLYIIFFQLDMLNSYPSLILAHSARAVPFGLWLMWQYFQGLPVAYEESAWINGASRLRTLWEIVFPMARPGVIAVTIFTFAVSWNDYTFASILMSDRAQQTLPQAIDRFINAQSINWGIVLAAGVVIILPAVLLVLFVQEHLLQGFNLGQ